MVEKRGSGAALKKKRPEWSGRFGGIAQEKLLCLAALDPHAEEGAVDEEEGHQEEGGGQDVRKQAAPLGGE